MKPLHFSEYLYRPYLDLADAHPNSPFSVLCLDLDRRSFFENKQLPEAFNMLSHAFFQKLRSKFWNSHQNITRPQDLDISLRNARWQLLCDAVENYQDLDNSRKILLLKLLRRFPFYEYIDQLVGQIDENLIKKDAQIAEIAYHRLMSRYMLGVSKIGSYTVAEAENFAEIAPKGTYAKVHATYITVQQSVKLVNDIPRLERSLKNYQQAIEDLRPHISENEYLELISRYYRVGAFLPQLTQKPDQMVDYMQKAEDFAFAIKTDGTADAEFAKLMVYYPVLESRIKEAMWIGEWELARQRCESLISISPYTPSAYLHYGQILIEFEEYENAIKAYEKSMRYGVVSEEVAYFMAGQCYEALGYEEKALDYYMMSIQTDPYAIGSIDIALELAEKLDNRVVKDWILNHKNILAAEIPNLAPTNELKAYQGRQFNEMAK